MRDPMKTKALLSIMAGLVVAHAASAFAAELCGNGLDDNANGLTDEGCWNLTSGQCESPLSCGETGSVSPKHGRLRYSLPPDVAPKVPYGPGIGFRRTYLSEFEPSSTTAPWMRPLGNHWQHTYMTWILKTGAAPSSSLVMHTSQGQDIRAAYASSAGGWDTYSPQAGVHYQYIRQRTTSPSEFQVRLLTGETLVYNSAGRLTEIWDTLATPNKVQLAYSDGNLTTVTDAAGTRRLSLSYSSFGGRLQSVAFQINTGSWTTQHTTTYGFDSPVAKDATSGWFVPASAAEWTRLLKGTGFSNPSSLYLMQQTSGSLTDSIGSSTATLTGTATYRVAVSGWTRKGIKLGDNSTSYFSMATPDASTTSLMLVQFYGQGTDPSGHGSRGMNRMGRTKHEGAQLSHGPRLRARSGFGIADAPAGFGTVRLVITKLDHARNELAVYSEDDVLKPTFNNQDADTSSILLGDSFSAADTPLMYAALFTGSAAELSDDQVTIITDLLRYGSELSSVTIGGQLAQSYAYDSTSGDLTQINDGGGKTMMTFAFSSATPGQVNLIDTPRGVVGFEYASSRAACSAKTVLYFNKGNGTSCDIDSDCGSGYLCGGKTGSGATGTCFRGARCLTVSSPSEDVVTAVAPLGPPSETCEGACAEVIGYVWSSTSPALDLKATQDAAGYYVSRAFDSNGLVTKVTYGDTDSDPDNGTSSREEYLAYGNASFPGKVTEIRRKSELSSSSCTATISTGCARTLYSYNADGLVSTITHLGTTLDSTGTNLAFESSTTFTYDKGRIKEVDGPLSGADDLTVFEYWTASGSVFKDGFLQNYKRGIDASHFVISSALEYDFWGNPTTLRGADLTASSGTGTVTCLSFSSARGTLSTRREAMASQADCSTSNGADLTTTFTRDSALRLTQLTRPDGSCLFYEYDTRGRLLRTKRRDDCNAASSGDRQEYVYDAEGLVTEVQTYDAASTLTQKQPYAYFDSRKLQKVINPVNTAKWTGIVYDDRGLISELNAPDGIGKSRFNRDPASAIGREGRITSEDRYKDATTFDTWNLLYDWIGNQLRVTDGDSKATETTRDDLGRTVKLTSPDMTYPTLYVYDNASRLTSMIESFGGIPVTHTFTYDNLDRLLTAYDTGTCSPGTASYQYDAWLEHGAPSCPSGVSCARTGGRLAYVKVTLMCSPQIDQETWYGYDDAGRLVREYVTDTSTRTADHQYAWTKNGALQQVTTPAGVVIGRTFGSVGSNSDTDLITALWRTTAGTPVIDAIQFYPYGLLKQYNQQNQIAGLSQRTAITRNLAYRISSVAVENQSNGVDTFSVAITEDTKGRVTTRDYTGAATGIQDSYFLYDDQDRVLCETTNLVSSCPTSGSNIKNSRVSPYFTNAGDWNQLLRPVSGSTGGLMNSFNPSGYGTSHQVTMVRQNDGSPAMGDTVLAYDARGNRTSDDNTSTLTNDRRDYTYDVRRNLINVHGKYSTGGVWHDYDVASVFDAKNRRVFKSFLDNTTLVQAQWYFYYDPMDRLVEVRYTPNFASPSTYSLFQLFWLRDRLVLYWQTDYPSVTTTRRYVGTDETGRPLDMWTWPTIGNGSRVWAVDPNAWGFDTNKVGPTVFQPVLFEGQYSDSETIAMADATTIHRPSIALNGFRTYDPFVAGYLQVDPRVPETRSSYGYVDSNPVGTRDPDGQAAVTVTVSGDFGICTGSSSGGYEFDQNQIECRAEPTITDGFTWWGGGAIWFPPGGAGNSCPFGQRWTNCGCLDWNARCDSGEGNPGFCDNLNNWTFLGTTGGGVCGEREKRCKVMASENNDLAFCDPASPLYQGVPCMTYKECIISAIVEANCPKRGCCLGVFTSPNPNDIWFKRGYKCDGL
jgi:RHS repeat-associated protein